MRFPLGFSTQEQSSNRLQNADCTTPIPACKRKRLLVAAGLLPVALIFQAATATLFGEPASAAAPPSRLMITAVAVAPEDRGFVRSTHAGVTVHDWDLKPIARIDTGLDHIHALAFSPDGKTLAIAGGAPGESGEVELWSWPKPARQRRIEGHDDSVYDVAWFADNKRLATVSADQAVAIWDSSTGDLVSYLEGHSGPVLALALTSDGKHLCSASADHTIRLWDPASGALIRSLTNHLGRVTCLAFRPGKNDGRPPYLASGSEDRTVRVWQPTINRMVRIVRHPAAVTAVAWTVDGNRLLSGSGDGILRLIDGDSDEVLWHRQVSSDPITCLAVRKNRASVVVGTSSGQLSVIDLP